MTRFYKHAWTSTEGEIIVKGKYGDGFLEWCKETEHLTDEQWKKGFESIKDEIAKNKIAGVDSWPPNYIEFVAMCLPASISPDGGNSGAYIVWKTEKRIEDKSHVAKCEKAGKSALNDMKGLFK